MHGKRGRRTFGAKGGGGTGLIHDLDKKRRPSLLHEPRVGASSRDLHAGFGVDVDNGETMCVEYLLNGDHSFGVGLLRLHRFKLGFFIFRKSASEETQCVLYADRLCEQWLWLDAGRDRSGRRRKMMLMLRNSAVGGCNDDEEGW